MFSSIAVSESDRHEPTSEQPHFILFMGQTVQVAMSLPWLCVLLALTRVYVSPAPRSVLRGLSSEWQKKVCVSRTTRKENATATGRYRRQGLRRRRTAALLTAG